MNNKTGEQILAEAILEALWVSGIVSMNEANKMKEYCAQKLQ